MYMVTVRIYFVLMFIKFIYGLIIAMLIFLYCLILKMLLKILQKYINIHNK